MTKFDDFAIPTHLAGLLDEYAKVSERLRIGENELTIVEVTKLKKKKLLLRTKILQTSYRTDRGPRISEAVLHPLSVDTLRILERRLKDEFDTVKTQVNHDSPDVRKIEDLLRRVTISLGEDSIFHRPLRLVEPT